MTTRFPRCVVLALLIPSLLWTGCGQMPPFEALFDDSPSALGTGITGVGLVRAVVIIAKYKATPRQREIAETRARRAYAKLAQAKPEPAPRRRATSSASAKPKPKAAAPSAAKPAARKKTSVAETTAPSRRKPSTPSPAFAPATAETRAPEPEPEPEPPAREPTRPKKKKVPRYIAVDTAPDERSQGARSVMIFDTYSQEIVGNNVYDIKTAPPILETAKFDTFAAQYVGSGSF